MMWLSHLLAWLQGTKACLGWDRGEAVGGQHANTFVVDAWLQLLQQAQQVTDVPRTQVQVVLHIWWWCLPAGMALRTNSSGTCCRA